MGVIFNKSGKNIMKVITVNGNTVEWEEGLTIATLLIKMNYTFKMLVIKMNGSLVKKDLYPTTTVPEGADVAVIHLISGG
jgi:thiamine biosynthesis protein ThiS